jgi:hypothetical protein
MIDGCSDIVDCENCGKIIPYDDSILHTRLACAKPDSHLRIRGPTSHKVLQTCRQMYQEARGILASSLKVYFDIQSGWTRSVLLRILLDHQFLRFAAPYVRHIYTTMRKKSQAGQLPLLFTNVECLEFGPGLGCWRQMILSTEEVCSGKDEENLLRWADGEVKRWTEDSEFHIKPGNSISWHLNIGGQLRDGLFCVSIFHTWLEGITG